MPEFFSRLFFNTLPVCFVALLVLSACKQETAPPESLVADAGADYQRGIYHPLHFSPAALSASNQQCLACHQEILADRPKQTSPAGIATSDATAWYQRLGTYNGEQENFHRRHLSTPFAKEVMNLQCNFCHTGQNPRDLVPVGEKPGFALRKKTDPETTCLRCHGQFDWKAMNLPGPWRESGPMVGGACLTCHASIRTERHQVNYLHAAAIEAAGAKNPDACYGCHGGRAWYGVSYTFPRHPWPGMPEETPAWAANRPQQSEERFRLSAESRK